MLHLNSKRITLVKNYYFHSGKVFLFWPQSILKSMGLIYCFSEIKHFNFRGGRGPGHSSQAQSLSFHSHHEIYVEKFL